MQSRWTVDGVSNHRRKMLAGKNKRWGGTRKVISGTDAEEAETPMGKRKKGKREERLRICRSHVSSISWGKKLREHETQRHPRRPTNCLRALIIMTLGKGMAHEAFLTLGAAIII